MFAEDHRATRRAGWLAELMSKAHNTTGGAGVVRIPLARRCRSRTGQWQRQLADEHRRPLRGPVTGRKFADAKNPLNQVVKTRTSLAAAEGLASDPRHTKAGIGSQRRKRIQGGHASSPDAPADRAVRLLGIGWRLPLRLRASGAWASQTPARCGSCVLRSGSTLTSCTFRLNWGIGTADADLQAARRSGGRRRRDAFLASPRRPARLLQKGSPDVAEEGHQGHRQASSESTAGFS